MLWEMTLSVEVGETLIESIFTSGYKDVFHHDQATVLSSLLPLTHTTAATCPANHPAAYQPRNGSCSLFVSCGHTAPPAL